MKKLILLVLAPLLLMIILLCLCIPVASTGLLLEVLDKNDKSGLSSENHAGSRRRSSGKARCELKNSDPGKADQAHTFNR